MSDMQVENASALQRARMQFPALEQRIGTAALVYLDNAATTQVPIAVLDAAREFELRDRANIHRGVHALSQRATDAFEHARSRLLRFVGAGSGHELVFTSGATEALNLAAHGVALVPGDEILVSGLEHHANLVPWQQAARRHGALLRILRPDRLGSLHPEDLARSLTPRTRIFAVTACANATGERPPYEALLRQASRAGALTVLDAAQVVAHEALDLGRLDADFVAFSGHKMHGPMGIGALVGRRAALERLLPLRYGGDMVEWVNDADAGFAGLPARLEGGTPNITGAVGFAAAAEFIDAIGRPAIDSHVRSLRAHAVAGLSTVVGLTMLSPTSEASAIVSFVTDGVHPHDVGTVLDRRGIAVRTGFHCAQPLLDHLGLGPTTRASFALYNTHEEVDRLIEAVAAAIEMLR